jgi:SAM-dependent methyltransferase
MDQRQTSRLVRYQYLEGLIDQRLVFELGCGDGTGTLRLDPWAKHIVAYEPDSDSLASARTRLQGRSVEFLGDSALPLPQADQSFDVVLVPELQRWLGDERVMPELRRVLKADGVAFFSVAAGEAGAADGLAYDALVEFLGATFEHVRIVGEVPFSGTTMADFHPDGDEIDAALDCSLVDEDEAPTAYLAICSDVPLSAQGYAVVQFPSAAVLPTLVDASSCQDELDISKRSLARLNRQLEDVAAKSNEKQRAIERLSLELRALRSAQSGEGDSTDQLAPAPGIPFARQLVHLKRQLKQKDALIAQLGAQRGVDAHPEAGQGASEPVETVDVTSPSSDLAKPSQSADEEKSEANLDHLRELLHEERQRSLEAARAVINAEAKAVQADALSEALVEARKAAEDQRQRAEGAERRCDILLARIEEGAAELASLHQRWAELQALRQADRWRIDELLGRLRSLEAEASATQPAQPASATEERLEAAQRRISELTAERDQLRVEVEKRSGN